jgi:hypothetical protein
MDRLEPGGHQEGYGEGVTRLCSNDTRYEGLYKKLLNAQKKLSKGGKK